MSDRPSRTYIVTAADEPDRLLRVLGPFAVAGASLVAVTLERTPAGVTIRIEAEGLADDRAEGLRERLNGLVGVRSVGVLQLCPARNAA